MTNIANDNVRKKKRKSKNSKTIAFDDELLTKDEAEQLLQNKRNEEIVANKSKKKSKNRNIIQETDTDGGETLNPKKKKRKKHCDGNEDAPAQSDVDVIKSGPNVTKKKKRNKHKTGDKAEMSDNRQNDEIEKKGKKRKITQSDSVDDDKQAEVTGTDTNKPKTESIRENKRKRYAKLLEEKKLSTDLAMQQNALNYLSRWKHSRSEWKFEKMRQVWLLKHLYDSDKIPDKFWDIVVEYFNLAKGKVRDDILKEALKLVDKDEEGQELEAEDKLKITRARDIIQSLQE